MSSANVWSDDWDSGPEDDWSGGRASSKRLVASGGTLGASVYELPPEGYAVYHFHHGSEELMLVLRGRPTLRTSDGERELAEGDVVHFTTGPDGAHGIHNRTSDPVRYLVAGTRPTPELVEYPDLGQLTAQSREPSQTGERLFVVHQLVDPPAEVAGHCHTAGAPAKVTSRCCSSADA